MYEKTQKIKTNENPYLALNLKKMQIITLLTLAEAHTNFFIKTKEETMCITSSLDKIKK